MLTPVAPSPPAAIPKSIPAKYRHRIEHWDDERGIGGALIVSLRDGWHWASIDPIPGLHVAGFDTITGALYHLRDTQPCSCDDCALTVSSAQAPAPQ